MVHADLPVLGTSEMTEALDMKQISSFSLKRSFFFLLLSPLFSWGGMVESHLKGIFTVVLTNAAPESGLIEAFPPETTGFLALGESLKGRLEGTSKG